MLALFSTPNENYFFDVNRNEVVPISDASYAYLQQALGGKGTDLPAPAQVNMLKEQGYFSTESAGRGGQTLAHHVGGLQGGGVKLGMEQGVQLLGLHPHDGLLLGDHALVHQVHGHTGSALGRIGRRGPLHRSHPHLHQGLRAGRRFAQPNLQCHHHRPLQGRTPGAVLKSYPFGTLFRVLGRKKFCNSKKQPPVGAPSTSRCGRKILEINKWVIAFSPILWHSTGKSNRRFSTWKTRQA